MQDCPIARHSPLPELQSLVKLFRPRSVSPNCVVPMLNGLDYFLLPSFMEGALQPAGQTSMAKERDAWFRSRACTIRKGPEVLLRLQTEQRMGRNLLDLLQQGDGSTFDDHIPERPLPNGVPLTPSTVNRLKGDHSSAIGRGRQAHASAQAMRFGAMGALSPEVIDLIAQHYQATGHPTGYPGLAQTPDGSDTVYFSDTDEEEVDGRRKRRRRNLVDYKTRQKHILEHRARKAAQQNERKVDVKPGKEELDRNSSGATHVKIAPRIANSAAVIDQQVNIRKLESCLEIGVDMDPEAKPQAIEPCIAPVAQKVTGSIKRYYVDKAHLAALFAVGEDPPVSP
jgi:hypothetical protein